jgi:hypothetical protein
MPHTGSFVVCAGSPAGAVAAAMGTEVMGTEVVSAAIARSVAGDGIDLLPQQPPALAGGTTAACDAADGDGARNDVGAASNFVLQPAQQK